MTDSERRTDFRGLLISLAAGVVLIYGLKAAQAIVVPFLLSVFLTVVGVPPLAWLRRKGVPNAVAVGLVVVGMVLVVVLMVSLIGTSVADFTSRIPYYRERLDQQITTLLESLGLAERIGSTGDLLATVDPGAAIDMVGGLLNSVSGIFNYTFLILFSVIFMLAEVASIPDKLEAAFSSSEETLRAFARFNKSLNRYIGLKTAIGLVTAIAVTIWVTILGLDFPLLWGVVAFLFNYVPNIGSIIAAIPAVLLALVQWGPGRAIVVGVGYLVINLLIGNLIEPRVLGRGLGLSTLVVFLSLVFWGWVLGPMGMLLSVPLTMTLVMALESHERTRRLALLLGIEAEEKAARPSEKDSS
ncbi:MAG: AI-2E family transporter [Nitrospirae bacterium]|nr:AI-2E family transporter [Nitrospirota bacterium]